MPDPIPSGEIRSSVIENRYLGLLTTYNVPWDDEKTARDVWQNFFDGQGGTLDGVIHSQTKTEHGVQVLIGGSGEYDYSHLMHMGGGTKSMDDSSAGGYREGAKVAALIMLTRMGANQVVHESGDWRLTYYLNDVPDYRIGDEPTKGLYARVERVHYQAGSRFSVKFPTPGMAKTFLETRNLFYSSENPDFRNPTYSNPEVGGFKLHKGKKGNIYEAGQRRHFRQDLLFLGDKSGGGYNAIEDITLWTKGKVFSADRDRGAVTKGQIEEDVIPKIVAGMTEEEIRSTIVNNPDFWYGRKKPLVPGGPKSVDIESVDDPDRTKKGMANALAMGEDFMNSIYDISIPGQLLGAMVDAYVEKYHGQPLEFPSQYVAISNEAFGDYDLALEGAGYVLCHPAMADLGMTTTAEAVKNLMSHFRIEPSEAENTRTGLLREFAGEIMGIKETPQIWMFSAAKEKSIFHGHYTPEFLWEAQERIHQAFSTALETYLHEISHERSLSKGHDANFVREFGKLYNVAMLNLEEAILDPTAGENQRVIQILKEWEATKDSLPTLPQRSQP